MYTEIKEAVNFIAKNLLGKIPRRSVSLFAQELANYLASRYVEVWDVEDPKSKERERIIRIRCGSTDPLIASSAQGVGLDVEELTAYLPENIHLHINPGEVFYKCSERSTPCPIWMGSVNSDDDYRFLPASALQPYDKDSASNLGAAGKSPFTGRPVYNDGVTPVDDAYIPLQLENVHPAAIDSPLKHQGPLKQFVFVPKDHKSYLVEDFAITRFGSHRNRPDHDVMRRIQQQAAMKMSTTSPNNLPIPIPIGLDEFGPRSTPIHPEPENSYSDALHNLTSQQREWLLKRLLELNFQEQNIGISPNSMPSTTMRNPGPVGGGGDGFSSLLASMPGLLNNSSTLLSNPRQNNMNDINGYGQFGNFNDIRGMSSDNKRTNWGHGDWE